MESLDNDFQVIRFPRCFGQKIFFEYSEPVLQSIFPTAHDTSSETDLPLWLSRLNMSENLMKHCWPEMYDELSANVRAIVPTSIGVSEHHSTGSDNTAGAAISTTLVPEPWFTEGIIHEHRHDLLNSLSLLDDLFGAGATGEAKFYSPWRPEPRPVVGLLHAIYVFTAVAEFYTRLLTVGGGSLELMREEIVEALGLQVLNLFNGLEELQRGASFSPFGRELFAALTQQSERLQGEAMRLGAFRSDEPENKAIAHYETWCRAWGLRSDTDVARNILRWAGR
jgi:HEXXH motif-containing protein